MVINFRAYGISQDAHKLAQTPILKKIIIGSELEFLINKCSKNIYIYIELNSSLLEFHLVCVCITQIISFFFFPLFCTCMLIFFSVDPRGPLADEHTMLDRLICHCIVKIGHRRPYLDGKILPGTFQLMCK